MKSKIKEIEARLSRYQNSDGKGDFETARAVIEFRTHAPEDLRGLVADLEKAINLIERSYCMIAAMSRSKGIPLVGNIGDLVDEIKQFLEEPK